MNCFPPQQRAAIKRDSAERVKSAGPRGKPQPLPRPGRDKTKEKKVGHIGEFNLSFKEKKLLFRLLYF